MQSQTPSGLKFLTIAAGTALGILMAVAGMNAWVDPFGMYRLGSVDGGYAYKPAIYTRVRLFKAYEVRRVRPQTVILGTSRTHIGISCSSPALARLAGRCYNLAFDGATTREMYDYLRHAYAIHPLNHVVLGLDTYHLVSAPSFVRPDFDPLVLDGDPRNRLPRWLRADLRLLTSFATLHASIETIRAQSYAQPNWFAPDGQRLGEVFFRREDENFVRYGPRTYFDEIDRLEAGFQTEGLRGDAPKQNTGHEIPTDRDETSFVYIRKIVDFCLAKNIDLRIFITPAHVHQLEITADTGGWPAIEEGKRSLVRFLAEAAARHPGRATIPLYDFSGYSSVTTEVLPPKGSREEMHFYWDSSHFKRIVGDYVLDRLFGVADPDLPRDFGMKLTPETIEPWLIATRKARAAYDLRYARDVTALCAMVTDAIRSGYRFDPASSCRA